MKLHLRFKVSSLTCHVVLAVNEVGANGLLSGLRGRLPPCNTERSRLLGSGLANRSGGGRVGRRRQPDCQVKDTSKQRQLLPASQVKRARPASGLNRRVRGCAACAACGRAQRAGECLPMGGRAKQAGAVCGDRNEAL